MTGSSEDRTNRSLATTKASFSGQHNRVSVRRASIPLKQNRLVDAHQESREIPGHARARSRARAFHTGSSSIFSDRVLSSEFVQERGRERSIHSAISYRAILVDAYDLKPIVRAEDLVPSRTVVSSEYCRSIRWDARVRERKSGRVEESQRGSIYTTGHYHAVIKKKLHVVI